MLKRMKVSLQKARFKQIVHHVNDHREELQSYMTEERRAAMKALIAIWNKKDLNMQDLFSMKEHHSYFNGQYPDQAFQLLWDDYVMSGLQLRCELLAGLHSQTS